jgi:hypothetical protein
MGKSIFVALLGVFVGALLVEVVRRRRTKTVPLLPAAASRRARAFAEAFREGYAEPIPTTATPS